MTDLNYDKLKNMSMEDIYNYLQEEYLSIFNNYNYVFKTSSKSK